MVSRASLYHTTRIPHPHFAAKFGDMKQFQHATEAEHPADGELLVSEPMMLEYWIGASMAAMWTE